MDRTPFIPSTMVLVLGTVAGATGPTPAPASPAALATPQGRTLATAFPLQAPGDWSFFATNIQNIDYFFDAKDLVAGGGIITTWIRGYDYANNTLFNLKWAINVGTKECMETGRREYDLKSGLLLKSQDHLARWQPIHPHSTNEALYYFFKGNPPI